MMSSNPREPLTKSEFEKALHSALNGLYNPAVLHRSFLIPWLDISQSKNPEYTLRKVLIDCIEALHPNSDVPLGSKTWRIYQILRRRFTEQILQRQVANELGISLRQLQREEKFARVILSDFLWNTYRLDESESPQRESPASQMDPFLTKGEDSADLKWLQDNLPVQDVNLFELIQEGLKTLREVLDSARILVECQCEGPSPVLFLQASLFRQGLLNLLNSIIIMVPGGKIVIKTSQMSGKVTIDVEAVPSSPGTYLNNQDNKEGLVAAGLFIKCCDGSMEIADPTESSSLHVKIILPILEKQVVLVVEDHEDTLRLFQRHLTGSRYCFVGANSIQAGLELAEEIVPKVIVLDVMMPESDGWEFLGRLRVNPKIMHIPVIVYSIVSQANLALSLGAAEFLHKPISRKDLLAALDRQITRSSKESD